MTCSRQGKLSPILRICAALMVLVWVGASGICSVQHLFAHAESDGEHDSAPAAHQHDAAPSDSGHSHDSDRHDGDRHACCDSLKATPQLAQSSLLAKPDFGKSFSLSFLWLTLALTPAQPEAATSLRQAPERDWVFTPEVCLGPAHRSHAPPIFA